jgi:hypothetical protein
MKKFRALRAIVTAGVVLGILDISSAFVIWWQRGVALQHGLQRIAAGLLGTKSYEGGMATAALGSGAPLFHCVHGCIDLLPGESQGPVFDETIVCFRRVLWDRRLHCDVLDRVAGGILNVSTPAL